MSNYHFFLGDRLFPRSFSLKFLLSLSWGSLSSFIQESSLSSFISRRTSLTETETYVIACPIAVTFESGDLLRAEHDSHTASTNCGIASSGSLLDSPANKETNSFNSLILQLTTCLIWYVASSIVLSKLEFLH